MADEVKTRMVVEGAEALQTLEQIAAAEGKHAESVKDAGQAAAQATSPMQRRQQSMTAKRSRLLELQRREVAHEQAVKQSGRSELSALDISRRRQQRIQGLARELGKESEAQRRANVAIKDSSISMVKHTGATNAMAQASSNASGKNDTLSTAIGAAKSQLAGLASGFVGVNGIIALYGQWIDNIETANQRLQENAEIVRANAEARLNFVALQGVEDPEDVKQIDALAAFAGRPPSEFARVLGILKSQFANESDENINTLALEVAAAAQLTDSPAQDLAIGLSAIFRQNGDAQAAGNIFQQAIQEAGEADPARLGVEIGKLIGVAQQFGGLDTGEAAGFASAGTALGLPNEVATTGLKNVFLSLRGRGTPEGNELLGELGVDRSNVITALQQISQARVEGRIDDAGLESIGGREAAPIFAALSDPAILSDFLASVGRVDRAEDFDGRLVTDKAEGIFTEGSIQALNLLSKQLESQLESTRAADTRAIEIATARSALELRLAELERNPQDQVNGVTAADSERILREFDFQTARGHSVEEALTSAIKEDDNNINLFRLPGFLPGIGGQNLGVVPDEIEGVRRTKARLENIVDPVLDTVEAGPQIEAPGEDAGSSIGGGNITVHGTLNMHTGDPLTDDLDGRDRNA